jgi:ribonuclease P/MRP protein subunit POP5
MGNKTQRIKPKALLSSLKEKKRYLVYELISPEKFNANDIKEAIVFSFKNIFGLDGLARAGLSFLDFEGNKGIIRTSTKGLDMLRASFCFVRKINKDDIIVRSIGVSGILKKARMKLMIGGES